MESLQILVYYKYICIMYIIYIVNACWPLPNEFTEIIIVLVLGEG